MQKYMGSALVCLRSLLIKAQVFRFRHSVGSQTNMKISPPPLSPPINGGELRESPLPCRERAGVRGFSWVKDFSVALLMTVLGIALLSGCASVTGVPDAQKQDNLQIIEKVPFFPQEDYQCGPASLAAVLHHWGVSVVPEEIGKAIYSQSARGTLNIDMVLYAQSRGLEAFRYRGAWDDLRKKIDAGFPLVVLVDYGFSVFQSNHFMVIIGYGEDSVVAHSGRHEKKVILREDFLKSWEKTGFWTLLIRKGKSVE